jgi:GalNAc-alpha-(1->4)-GalNAc-alpha-(1->3)-diNAcBac-PP-undecaprenol alpha-1,4-N-acetyl-D-galactosaminyltransferase
MSKKTIVLYFFRLERSSGGAERMILWLAGELAERGHDVHLVSWDRSDASLFYPLNPGVTWHRLEFALGWRDKVRRTRRLVALLDSLECDVFIGFVMGADKTIHSACRIARVPIVAAERNSPEMYKFKFGALARWFYMSLFGMCARIVVQFEQYKRGYPQWLNPKITAIHNPVYHPPRISLPGELRSSHWILLCVARLEFQKNVGVLIKSFASLHQNFPQWKLRIIGEGSLRPELERQIFDCRMSERIVLAGAVEDISSEYVQAHLFCMPSLWEGFPNALAEAMAHGLPAVGFDSCPGVSSLITDGVNGVLATGNGDESSLAIALRRVMTDSGLRVRLGSEAAKLPLRFDAAEIVTQWEDVILHAAHD